MRTAIVLAVGVFLAGEAEATGINLFWNDCAGGNGVIVKTFACNTNDGYQELYVSVDPPEGVVATIGHNHILDLQSASSPLPAWWDFKNPGTCRMFSLTASGDFSTSSSGGFGCVDPWQGQGNAGVAAYSKGIYGLPNRARIIGSIAPPSGMNAAMPPGTEYYSIRFRINNWKTVGLDACGGCPDPVCFVLNQVRIAQPAPEPTFAIENPLVSTYAAWQQDHLFPYCTVPAVNRTWGQVKSLYR